jgi:hypothetical protein
LTELSTAGLWTRDSSGGGFGNLDAGGGFATNSGQSAGGSCEIRNGLIVRRFNDGSPKVKNLIFDTGTEIMIGDKTLEPSGG